MATLTGKSTSDLIAGTDGDDEIWARGGADIVFGSSGRDRIFGEDGDDLLDGGHGDDALDGGNGNDLLLGGDGRDRLTGGAGNDFLDGGDGVDTAFFSGKASDYAWTTILGVTLLQDRNTRDGNDGIDLLTRVERLSFGFVSLVGLLLLVPTSLVTAKAGAAAAHKIPKQLLAYLFAAYLILVSARFILSVMSAP